MANSKRLLTLNQLHQEQPNISKKTLIRDCQSGKLKAKKIGNQWLVSRSAWNEYLKPDYQTRRNSEKMMRAVEMAKKMLGDGKENKGDLAMSSVNGKAPDRLSLGNMGYYKRVHKVHKDLKYRTEPIIRWTYWWMGKNKEGEPARLTKIIPNCNSNEEARMFLKMKEMEQFTNQFICPHCGKHMFTGEQVQTVKEDAVQEVMTFQKFWEDKYSPYYKAENSKNSYKSLKGIMKNYLLPRFGEKKLEDINQEDVDSLKKDLIELGRKKSSLNKVLKHFRALLVKAVDYRYISNYPKFKLMKEDDKRERKVMTNEEFWAIYNCAEDYLKPIMIIQREAFCRPNELLKITWDDVVLNHKEWKMIIDAEASKTKEKREVYFSKSTGKLFEELLKNRNGNELVFPVSRNKYFDDFKEANEKAGFKGIKRFTPHDLRSTGATMALRNGVDMDTVRKRGGWKNLSVLQDYLKSDPETQRKAAEVISANGKV